MAAKTEGWAARPDIQNKLRQREKDVKLVREARLRRLMSNIDFRSWVYELIFDDFPKCNVMGQSDTGNSRTFFNEGARSVGIALTNEIQVVSPEDYLKMIHEQIAEKSKEDEYKTVVKAED